jgi:deaminated glutathione amidase
MTPHVQLVTCNSPAGRLALSTCYDLRFPELYQRLVHDGGAQVILVPSAFTKPTGAAHWHTLLRARAIECQAFVIAAAQVGVHNVKRESYGHTVVFSPWGDVLGEMGGDGSWVDEGAPGGREGEGILAVQLDLGELERVRERMPMGAHRAKGKPVVRGPIRQL